MCSVLFISILYIEFAGVYKSCPKGIFHRFIGRVHTKFPEDVLSVSVDGVNGTVTFRCNLFGSLSFGYCFRRFHFYRSMSSKSNWHLNSIII